MLRSLFIVLVLCVILIAKLMVVRYTLLALYIVILCHHCVHFGVKVFKVLGVCSLVQFSSSVFSIQC